MDKENTIFKITKKEYLYSITLSPDEEKDFYEFLRTKYKYEKEMSKAKRCYKPTWSILCQADSR